MNRHVRFITLGCKVNQYETQAMRESLEKDGLRSWTRAAGASAAEVDFVVINTCSVTQSADKENLYWIRRARREHPLAKIVVTGCMAERDGPQLRGLPEVDLVVSNYDKADLAQRLDESCARPSVQEEAQRLRERRHFYAPLSISKTQGHGRAFVKIQDGCNHACSFCKVVLVRGRSRSRKVSDIRDEILRLRDAGYREIVFAGIQLGAYGDDLEVPEGLARLLESSAAIDGIERLRLSSIEPTDVTPVLIETLAGIAKCCPHLHIPLQSGDDEILQKMNRRYARGFYRDLAVALQARLPDFSLTLDVMAGFPGEAESHFANTVELLQAVKPLKCHVFPYSRRAGTRAAAWNDTEEKTVRERVRGLMELSDGWGRDVRRAYLGRSFQVLVEESAGQGLLQGLTANYLKVCFPGPASDIGQMFPVQLLHLEGDLFLGRALDENSGDGWKL